MRPYAAPDGAEGADAASGAGGANNRRQGRRRLPS